MEGRRIAVGSTTYFVSGCEIPGSRELPWLDEECDAFVAILEPGRLKTGLADDIAVRLVRLRTDWVETMGGRSEFLHDHIDNWSVAIGRQVKVGDGSPMTAWHEDIASMEGMTDYIGLGGLGASDNKLVVVVGPDDSASLFASSLARAVTTR